MKFKVDLLHPHEEYELIVKVYTTLSRDKKSREKLFRSYLPLAKKEAAKFSTVITKRNITFDDLFSEAMCGLLVAIDKIDPTRCQRLSPVAKLYIRDALRVYMMNNSGVGMKLSQSSNARRIYFGVNTYCREHNILPPFTAEQRHAMAIHLKTDAKTISVFEDLRSSSCAVETILERPCGRRSPEDQANFSLLTQSLARMVEPHLSEMEYKYFVARYIDGDEVTLDEFAATHSIPPNKARVMARDVLNLLRSFINKDHLVGLMGDSRLKIKTS